MSMNSSIYSTDTAKARRAARKESVTPPQSCPEQFPSSRKKIRILCGTF